MMPDVQVLRILIGILYPSLKLKNTQNVQILVFLASNSVKKNLAIKLMSEWENYYFHNENSNFLKK